jgi:glycerol kinase
LGTICYKVDGKATYALEGSIFVAGAVVQWLRDNLKMIKSAKETEQIVNSLEHNSDVFLVPAFTGLGCPYWDADARGALYGITRDTGKNEITRAAIESVAYQTRDLFKAMSEDGISPQNLRVDGGMTNNNWLMQFLANILKINVEKPKITETTALGAAMMAAYTDGKFSSLEELSKLWSSDKTFKSKMNDNDRNILLGKWDYYVSKTLT